MLHKNEAGFTLSELLISLSVLGLIAALTMPKIYTNVNTLKKKAVIKEVFSVLSNLATDESQQGGRWISSMDLFRERLNTAKCSTNMGWSHLPAGDAQYGCELHNGAIINYLQQGGDFETFTLDWNGAAGPNQAGVDRIGLIMYWGVEPTTVTGGGVILTLTGKNEIRPGEVLPITSSRSTYESTFRSS